MNKQSDRQDFAAAASGFDFGTSPHGLSADLHQTDQETPEALGLHFHAKPVFAAGEPDAGQAVSQARSEAGARVGFADTVATDAQRAEGSGIALVLTASQFAHLQQAVNVACMNACCALEDEPFGAHEIQPDIDGYNELYLILQAAQKVQVDSLCVSVVQEWQP